MLQLSVALTTAAEDAVVLTVGEVHLGFEFGHLHAVSFERE
jgi:hypothetical protein